MTGEVRRAGRRSRCCRQHGDRIFIMKKGPGLLTCVRRNYRGECSFLASDGDMP
jgi:hypothetical protein